MADEGATDENANAEVAAPAVPSADMPVTPAPAPELAPVEPTPVPEPEAIELPEAESPPAPLAVPPEVPPSVPPPEPAPAPTPMPASPQPSIKNLQSQANQKIKERKRLRLEKIVQLAQKRGRIVNDDVEKLLHVSNATATRYLSMLVKSGQLKRFGTRGGAWYEPSISSNGAV